MKRFNHIFSFLAVIVPMVVVMACSSSDGPDNPMPETTRTALVYMVADNNLYPFAKSDTAEMRSAVRAGLGDGNRWLVYYSSSDHRPRLIEFDKNGNEKVLATYDSGEKSVSVERMRRVIDDVKRLAPADEYGLVLWSHGTGWLNDRYVLDEPSAQDAEGAAPVSPQSFGHDGGCSVSCPNYGTQASMKTSSLAAALDGLWFEYIYFDCCHMANVEVIYLLRNVTGRIVACPTELGVEGMPYRVNVPHLLAGRVKDAAKATYDYYSRQYLMNGGYGCAIGVYSTAAITDYADALRDIVDACGPMPDEEDYYRVPYFRTVIMSNGIYDLNDYVKALRPDAQRLSAYMAAADRLVEYFATTARVYNLDASRFSGVAGNIVDSKADVRPYNYGDIEWCDLVWGTALSND